MSVIHSDRQVPLGAVTAHRLVTLGERAWGRFTAWRNVRATEKALAALTDAELADIGLHRGAITPLAERLARG